MTKKQKKLLTRVIVALCIFAVMEVLELAGVFEMIPKPYGLWVEFAAFLIP